MNKGMTIREAAELWVRREMDFIQTSMIDKLMRYEPEDWMEVTTPSRCDRVYVYNVPGEEHCGEIENYLEKADVWLINLDDGNTVEVGEDDFAVERDSWLPAWGTMFSFKDSADIDWLEGGYEIWDENEGIKALSRCGFRVYKSDEFGYFFGIDAGGFDFYEAFWVPLYKARGLQWHDPETERKEAS